MEHTTEAGAQIQNKILSNGIKVKIAIRDKRGYVSGLYNAIQGQEGVIVRKMELEYSSYKDAYLIQFDEAATKKYNETAVWKTDRENMVWWTERTDFKIIK